MKTVKRRFEHFLFYDDTGIAAHLAKMVARGWQLEKITPLYWQYRKIEPQKLHYTVAYFSEASEFNPYPTENQVVFHSYCNNAGWKLVTQWAQMQIFCAQQENATPIETDELIKLKAIHRAMKKNFLPGSIAMLLLSLFQIVLPLYMGIGNPIYLFSNKSSLSAIFTWSLLALCVSISLGGYFIWHHKSQKSVEIGGNCMERTRVNRKASTVILLLTAISAGMAVFNLATQHFGWVGVLTIVSIAAVTALVMLIKNAMKRANASRRLNFTVTIASCFILSIVFTGLLLWGTIHGINSGLFRDKPIDTYTTTASDGSAWTWEIYRDSIPLKVEDLQDVDYTHYSYQWTEQESFLLAQFIGRQDSFPDGKNAPQLHYEIVEVKLPILFNLCLNDYLSRYDYPEDVPETDKLYFFRQTDDPAWRADAVYQLYDREEARSEYLLCWENRIVSINFDEIPTAEQIAVSAQKLSQ